MSPAARAIPPLAPEEPQSDAALSFSLARGRGLVCRVAEDDRFDGRCITLDGRRLINFGSCSYLGLETDARLKTAACEAVLRYGVQFSASRAYVSAPLYRDLEEHVSTMVGGAPVVIAPSTSLAHLSAIPVLIREKDAVLYDIQVHASVQGTFAELRQRGIPCEPVRHNRLDRLEERVRALSAKHDRIFYLCDGVYSMHGDVLDVAGLYSLLDRQPALWAYVDDAHGFGWSGQRGAGTVLGHRCLHQRMVVAFGLSKSFAAAGGAIVLPHWQLADQIVTNGRTMIFSGPLQPAQLGAGLASARIHLSDELPRLQRELVQRIDTFDDVARLAGVPVLHMDRSPIRFVQIGDERAAVEAAFKLMERGFYVNVACYPAVPRRRAGIRLMLNLHQRHSDIEALANELASLTVAPRKADFVAPSSRGPEARSYTDVAAAS